MNRSVRQLIKKVPYNFDDTTASILIYDANFNTFLNTFVNLTLVSY